MPDVVAHNVFDEQGRQQNTDNGINEEEPVGLRRVKLGGQQVLYLVNQGFEQLRGKGREHADKQTKQQQILPLRQVIVEPCG